MNAITPTAVNPSSDTSTTDLLYAPVTGIFSLAGPMMHAKGWTVIPQDRGEGGRPRKPAKVEGRALAYAEFKERRPTDAELALWCLAAPRANVAALMGATSGHVFAVDIDVLDVDMAESIRGMATRILGATPLVRVGRAPKVALFYRYVESEGAPVNRALRFEGEGGHLLEVQSTGKLMTMHGLHHVTGRYYDWPVISGNPLAMGADAAPEVTAAQLQAFLDAVAEQFPFRQAALGGAGGIEGVDLSQVVVSGDVRLPRVVADEGKLTDGREDWLTRFVLPAVCMNGLSIVASKERGDDVLGKSLAAQVAAGCVEAFRARCEMSGRWTDTYLRGETARKVSRVITRMLDPRDEGVQPWLSGRCPGEPSSPYESVDENTVMNVPPAADVDFPEFFEAESPEGWDDMYAPAAVPEPAAEATPHAAAAPAIVGKAAVRVVVGDVGRTVDAIEEALVGRDTGIYRNGGVLVRVTDDLVTVGGRMERRKMMVVLDRWLLADIVSRHVLCTRYDAKNDAWRSMDLPMPLMDTLLSRSGSCGFPLLTAIVTCPTLRPDGSLLSEAGYDPATGFYVDLGGRAYGIPETPTRADAERALGVLKDMVQYFPFTRDQDRSVALACMLTATVRRSMDFAPLFGFSSTIWGSGKGKLVNIASIMSTGARASTTFMSKDEKEVEKNINAKLLKGSAHLALDEVKLPLGGPIMNAMMTSATMELRIMQTSTVRNVSTACLVTATGLNISVAADMNRRAVLCKLDPNSEQPHMKEFAFEPDDKATEDRHLLVAAALTIMRAYILSGADVRGMEVQSFRDWTRMVCRPLVWLGEPDPVLGMLEAAEEDDVTAHDRAVLIQWRKVVGLAVKVTAKALINAALARRDPNDWRSPFVNEDFREALMEVCGNRNAGTLNSKDLGVYLRGIKGKITGGLKAVPGPMADGIKTWVLEGEAATGEATPNDKAQAADKEHTEQVSALARKLDEADGMQKQQRMLAMAKVHFGSKARAEAWLFTNHPALGGAKPVDALSVDDLRVNILGGTALVRDGALH